MSGCSKGVTGPTAGNTDIMAKGITTMGASSGEVAGSIAVGKGSASRSWRDVARSGVCSKKRVQSILAFKVGAS